MRRVVEFDLVTKSEGNRRGNAQIAQIIHAKEVAAQRAIVGEKLREALGRTPPPLHVVDLGDRFGRVGEAIGLTVRNAFRITITRIASGTLDDDNISAALKHVRDEIAVWCGVPNDRDPVYKFTAPQPQRKAPHGVARVEIEIADLLTGDPIVKRFAETRSEGVQAAARVKRAVKKAQRPTVNDLHATAERLLSPPRDPGEERSAREIADCTTCGARVPDPCKRRGEERFPFGVHVARARAAGLHVPEDDRATVKAARAPRGPRKLVPAARPAGQTVLPMLRAFVALPWEQPTCGGCDGSGVVMHGSPHESGCAVCRGTGRAKGRVLARAARYDGLDEPPASIPAEVPPEHATRYGRAPVVLRRTRFDSATTGPCWVYEANDERRTT